MKLRNKKTGKLIDINLRVNMLDENYISEYDSLEEFNDEWEDYEEPKSKYLYVIDPTRINFINNVYKDDEPDWCEQALELGIGFETKEEAEKAVEKLKAWKRLKDNGFKFEGIEKRGHHIKFYQGKSYETDKQCQQAMNDLNLLFGGEE